MKKLLLLLPLIFFAATIYSVAPANKKGHRYIAPLNKISQVPEGYFILNLYKSDFSGNEYLDIKDCAMTRAARRYWKADDVTSASNITVWRKKVLRNDYLGLEHTYKSPESHDVINPINCHEFRECQSMIERYDDETPIWRLVVEN